MYKYNHKYKYDTNTNTDFERAICNLHSMHCNAWSRVGGTTPYLILFWIPDWDSQRKISSFFCLHLPYQQIGEKSLPIFSEVIEGILKIVFTCWWCWKKQKICEWLLSAVKCTGFAHPDLSLAQSKMSNCWSYNPKNILKNPFWIQ